MLRKLTVREWLDAKAGILNEEELHVIEDPDKYTRFYTCPCGEKDHYAVRKMIVDGQQWSDVLNCFETMKQWAIRPRKIDITGIIESEELKYAKILDLAEKLVPKIISKRGESPETFFFLKDSHGIEEELAREIWGRHERHRSE